MSAGNRTRFGTCAGLVLIFAFASQVSSSGISSSAGEPQQAPSAPGGLRILGPGSDTTPPVISLITTSSITSSGAKIGWTTNEASDSQVIYGPTTAYGSTSSLNATPVTAHTVTLSGLAQNTLYHFRVRSSDVAGNPGMSADATFTTTAGTSQVSLAPQDTSINVNATNYSGDTTLTTYTWPDNQIANAILMKFDLSSLPAGAVVQQATLNLALVQADTAPETTYVVTVNKVVGKNPVVATATGYTADGVTSWTPNTCCSGNAPMAQADISLPYATQAINKAVGYKTWTITTMAQEWRADPSSNFGLLLNADTSKLRDRYRYFASVEHADPTLRPYLNIAYSLVPDVTPPAISAVATSSITSSGTTISWTTNEASDSRVEYGTTTAYGSMTTLSPTLVTSHVISLAGLTGGTLYHYRVRSKDPAGNLAVSGDFTFTTRALDSVPPSASITAPIAGATVSNSVTVSASASDNIGVVGVQFKLDGANMGAEDTGAPYSISWNTTTAANGGHTITAMARDAAGNQTSSAAVGITVSNAPSGGVLFESNWNTATGSTNAALTDGGRWPIINQYDSPPTPGVSVVSGGPNGQNALRVQQRGPSYPVEVAKTNFASQSTNYFLRYYFKTDDTSSAGDHIVTVGPGIAVPPGDSLTFMRKYGGGSDWRMTMSAFGCGDPHGYPMQHWGPGPRLANGQWYRLEYHVEFVDSTHMRVHPRIYNATGALLYDDDDFRQEGWGSSNWNGRNDWTLASFYAAGHTFCVNPVVMNDFGLGNNGQANAANTGLYWYFAGVQVRSDTWPGPLSGGGGGDATPPAVSVSAPSSGATVTNSVTVSAAASDNVGVAGVQFKVDGTNLGAEDTTSPYSVTWATTTATNGSHPLSAVARDAAGNQTVSSGVPVTVSNSGGAGIAALYPGDVGIESHSDVVFVEKFEEPTLTDLFNRWTDIRNGGEMSFSTDVPAGSPPGSHSVNIPIIGGTTDGGHLYKLFGPGFDDTLYVRYYIKYPTTGSYRHDGIWLGGRNPPLTYPYPQAGTKPVGNDRFIASAEQTDSGSRFDHYNYWMNMRVSGDGSYWGNLLLNSPGVTVTEGPWVCVEQMVKLNNPVSSFNGEHAIWLNGVKVSHLGQGFPNGSWSGGIFTQNPSGSPFEGFRWRSDANLKLNYIWLQNYSVDNSSGIIPIKFDHVVVAKSYIGCLQ